MAVPPWKQPNEDPFLTAADVARVFNMSRAAIVRWMDEGLIKHETLPSGVRRVRLSEVRKHVAVHLQGDDDAKENAKGKQAAK